jgi:hypothetical protein
MADERYFLQLMDETEDVLIIKNILKSPLGLSEKLIKMLFENNYDWLIEGLDEIKLFAGGIKRANEIYSYSLASYYTYMFSFHQYFNSSFRARQGKVLEAILQDILENYCGCNIVPRKPAEAKKVIKDLFNTDSPNLDIDVVGINSTNSKTIMIQLRSRDDTGGTTAKSSLVELLKEFLRNEKDSKIPLLYLVAIWDTRDSRQKKSTIEKMYSSLKDYIEISRDDFYSNITNGIQLEHNLTLQLGYGVTEISEILYNWSNSQNSETLISIEKVVNNIEKWDDLWISYAISSLELDIKFTKKFSNIDLLNKYLKELNLSFNRENPYATYVLLIDDYTTKIMKRWIENSIPFQNPAEQYLYIRDLLFLRACYEKLSI